MNGEVSCLAIAANELAESSYDDDDIRKCLYKEYNLESVLEKQIF